MRNSDFDFFLKYNFFINIVWRKIRNISEKPTENTKNQKCSIIFIYEQSFTITWIKNNKKFQGAVRRISQGAVCKISQDVVCMKLSISLYVIALDFGWLSQALSSHTWTYIWIKCISPDSRRHRNQLHKPWSLLLCGYSLIEFSVFSVNFSNESYIFLQTNINYSQNYFIFYFTKVSFIYNLKENLLFALFYLDNWNA